MDKLTHIVDSLNLQHKICDLHKKSYSISQTIGHIVEFEGGNFENALKDMRENISLKEFRSKYPCLLYTSPSPRDLSTSRMPSSA